MHRCRKVRWWNRSRFRCDLVVKAGSDKLSPRGVGLDADDFGACGMEAAKKIAGGDGDGQMGIHPYLVLEIEGDSRFADVVRFRPFRERVPGSIETFHQEL